MNSTSNTAAVVFGASLFALGGYVRGKKRFYLIASILGFAAGILLLTVRAFA